MAKLPEAEQRSIVTQGPSAVRKAAATSRKASKAPSAPPETKAEASPHEQPSVTHSPLAAALIAVIAEQNGSGECDYRDPVWAAEADRADIAKAASILADRCGIGELASPAEKALSDIVMQIIALVGPWT